MADDATSRREAEPAGIRLGISACLLGRQVRFDGGHKRDPQPPTCSARHFRWLAVCPEVEIGLGTPRESLRLVRQLVGTPAGGTSRSG